MHYNSFELALLIILVYLCVWGIINRICRCIEIKYVAEAYSNYMKATVNGRTENANHFAIGFRDAMDTLMNKDKTNAKENQNSN